MGTIVSAFARPLDVQVASLTARTEQLSRDNESLQTELTGTKSNADTYAEMVESLKANANQLEQDKLAMEKRLESAGANASSSSNSNANLSEQVEKHNCQLGVFRRTDFVLVLVRESVFYVPTQVWIDCCIRGRILRCELCLFIHLLGICRSIQSCLQHFP